MKRFLCGVLVGALMTGGMGVFAVSYVANPAMFEVLVNGKAFESDPPVLEVEGRTYLPLRAMGEALGVPVVWNEEFQRAEVGTAPSYSKENPAGLFCAQSIQPEGSQTFRARLQTMEIIRGEDAWALLQETEPGAAAAGNGYEYLAVRMALFMEMAEGETTKVSPADFICFSGSGEQYAPALEKGVQPVMDYELVNGVNAHGIVTFRVKTDDPAPKMAFGMKEDGTGGIWFSLAGE